jgi:hypothetical protein
MKQQANNKNNSSGSSTVGGFTNKFSKAAPAVERTVSLAGKHTHT